MDAKKKHVILTTKKCGEFAVSTDQSEVNEQLDKFSEQWVAKLNAKYAGTDLEVVSYRAASDEEVKDFKHLTTTTINLGETSGE